MHINWFVSYSSHSSFTYQKCRCTTFWCTIANQLKLYGTKLNKWNALNILSLTSGRGYISIVPTANKIQINATEMILKNFIVYRGESFIFTQFTRKKFCCCLNWFFCFESIFGFLDFLLNYLFYCANFRIYSIDFKNYFVFDTNKNSFSK